MAIEKPSSEPVDEEPAGPAVEVVDATYNVRILRPGAKPYFRVLYDDPATGKGREISGGRSIQEARRRSAAQVVELDAGVPLEGKRRSTTLERCAELWLESSHPRWDDLNRTNHTSRLRVHIVPILGAKRMGSLRKSDAQAVLDAPKLAKLRPATITNVGRTLGQFATWAESEGYCGRNFMDGISIADYANPHSRKDHGIDPDDEGEDDDDEYEEESEAERGAPVITAAMVPNVVAWRALAAELAKSKVPWMGLGCELSATSGVRYSELAALAPQHFNWDEDFFWVRRTPRNPTPANPRRWKPTKNRTRRKVPFPAYLKPELMARAEAATAMKGNPDNLLFCAMGGGRMPTSNFHDLALQDALDAVKVTGVWASHWLWRDLRHTAATWMLQSVERGGMGMDEIDVSSILGHASSAFTRRQYVGTLGEAAAAGAAAMEGFRPA